MTETTVSEGLRCMVMRGGTSKGLYFLAGDLPGEVAWRDALLLSTMGSPDPRQIDGMGGAHPLTSKVAVVGPPTVEGADVDYLFLQVVVDQATVTDKQNCGNILAGVGPFAVERGLVSPSGDHAEIRIHLVNTGGIATATFPLDADGRPIYAGDTAIAGVPGTAAPVRLDFADTAGSSCGALLPTGNRVDQLGGIDVTLVDNGMPVVVMAATDLDIGGYETPAELEADASFAAASRPSDSKPGRSWASATSPTPPCPSSPWSPHPATVARSAPEPSFRTGATTPSACSAR
jgi:4-oxalomesaconate tautomerase